MNSILSSQEKGLLYWLIEKNNQSSDKVLYENEDSEELRRAVGDNLYEILKSLGRKGIIDVEIKKDSSNSFYISVFPEYIQKYKEEKSLYQNPIEINNNAPNIQTYVNTGNGNIISGDKNKVKYSVEEKEKKENKFIWQIIVPIIITIIGGVVLYYLGIK